ncbi:MAG: hypothetical protein IKJ34_01420, partial [Mailhella sp.]|nr:hypothetical protein [Mailhella sp.]
VSGSENESLKTIPGHGMARVMASKGLCAFIFRSSESLTEKRSPVEKMLCRDAAKLLRCARQEYSLENTPFGQSSFCRYCLDGQYSKHQGWQSTCADMGFYPPAVSSIVPDIAKKSEDELRNTLHRLMEECPSSLQESPLHSLLPPPAILAAYDSVGLCPLAPLPDTDERLLNIIASLAKNSHGGIWSAESILRVGAETINRENAFNTWALA